MAADANRRLSALPLLTPAEVHALAGWNDTAADLPPAAADSTLADELHAKYGTEYREKYLTKGKKERNAVLDAFKQPVDQVIARNPSEVAPFPDLFAVDTPGKVPTAAPMLVYQGLSDDVVYKVFTDQYVKKACALGNTVEYKTFTGKDHYEENDAAEKDVLEWMQARLAGEPAPSTC